VNLPVVLQVTLVVPRYRQKLGLVKPFTPKALAVKVEQVCLTIPTPASIEGIEAEIEKRTLMVVS
jgi:hypothetical protein